MKRIFLFLLIKRWFFVLRNKMLLFYWKAQKKSCCTRRWGSYTLMKRETEAELKDAHPSWSMRSMLKEGCASWSSAEVSLFFSVCCSTWGAAYFLLRFSVKQYFFNCSFLLLMNKYKKNSLWARIKKCLLENNEQHLEPRKRRKLKKLILLFCSCLLSV